MKRWMRRHSRTYISIPQWFRDISKHELVVGTRIHGCQLALQAGVPAVCLYIDSRTKELCETMQIPSLSAHELQKAPSVERLLDTLKQWDWEQYDENRMSLAKQTIEFVKNNKMKPSMHLQKFR
jgi:polysaccharide pyruvyl transferase WcaK-like protein